MPTTPLPENPDLDQLRTRARELQRAVRSGDEAALALVAEFHPDAPPAGSFPLAAAQTVVARRYRFPSWPRLRRHVEIINARTWNLPPAPSDEPAAERFLRLACLNFEDDDPARRSAAAQLLADRPELPRADLAVAAAGADVTSVRALIAGGASAQDPAGPYRWPPLMYLAFARHDPRLGRGAVLDTARALLAGGADPNDGRFFLGLPTPFTVLTGVFAGGSTEQPAHPHSLPLARLLLGAGAEANDGQTLYNRMFGPNDDFLLPLFEFGLGRGDGGPWRRLLGEQIETPLEMVTALLVWALQHDQRDRVRLLAGHGVDVLSPVTVARLGQRRAATPIEIARLNGYAELADILRGYGAVEPRLDPVGAFVAAALAGDAATVRAAPSDLVARARRTRPGLVVWAASQGHADAVRLLVAAGFDIDALARGDVPREQKWQTALHTAVERDDVGMARLLLELGADPAIADARFDATPLGWARHLDRPELIELLAPGTP